jgi:hypothetical protein
MKVFDKVKTCATVVSLVAACGLSSYARDNHSRTLHSVTPRSISVVASTVPANGDVNPYGLVVVPKSSGALVAGNLLISNFNSSANLQGTGTTIVQISPDGTNTLFAWINPSTLPGPCPGGIGLTTALSVLSSGWVIVGSLPTTDGTSATAQAGCLLVLNNMGTVVETFYGSLINGPWDMTAYDLGSTADLFVTNVLNGTVAGGGNIVQQGTVTRLNLTGLNGSMPTLESITVIGSGFSERTDPAALVIGPTGVGLSPDWQTLYVADSLNNGVQAITNPVSRTDSAGTGTTVSTGGFLNDPLGLFVANTGDIFTVNGNNGIMTEITPGGTQVFWPYLDISGNPPGAGALFGLVWGGHGLYYVDDATNTLNLFQ